MADMTTTERFEKILEGAMRYAPEGVTREAMTEMLLRMEASPAPTAEAPIMRHVVCPHCRRRTLATLEVEFGGREGWVVCEECTETFVVAVRLRAGEVLG